MVAAPIKGAGMKSYSPQFPHLGIGYLSAMLLREGHEVEIVDMRLRYNLDDLSNFADKFRPDFFGITTFSFHYLDAYKIIEHLKNRYPEKPVIMGGPHVAAFKKSILEESKCDFALHGEGEYAILEFCEAIKNGASDFSHIPGLFWRKDGQIIENPTRAFLNDLNGIPFPAYDKFELNKYIAVKERKLLPIITSRGCPYSCVYCSVRLSMGRGFRPRSAENVVDEIEYWYNKGFRTFDINDDNFTVDMTRAERICDLILERGLKIEYRMINGIRADRIDENLARKMKQSGCSFVSFGVETGNPEIMKNIKKGLLLENVRKAVDLANKVGWVHRINFIIGHPGETYDKAMDSIRFAGSLPSEFVTFYTAIPYPGTELFEWIKKNGSFINPPEVYLNNMEYVDPVPIFETNEFTYDERLKALRKGALLSRKKYLEFALGKIVGNIAYVFARSDSVWSFAMTVSQGTGLGYKIFMLLVGRWFRKKLSAS